MLEGQFVRFLKSTLQSDLQDKLNIEIESIPQKRGDHKLFLVSIGGNPKFEEALVSIYSFSTILFFSFFKNLI